MDSIETIDRKIVYLRNLINDWNLESETVAVYESKIAALVAERELLEQMKD